MLNGDNNENGFKTNRSNQRVMLNGDNNENGFKTNRSNQRKKQIKRAAHFFF